MTRAILRSIGAGLVTLAVLGVAALVKDGVFCPLRRPVDTLDGSQVIFNGGYQRAKPEEAIYACESSHCIVPFGCHDDYACYCAPATLGAVATGALVGGRCVVDELPGAQSRGACPNQGCDEHLKP